MEWKLQRITSRRIKTDEDMLWEDIMKTLGKELRRARRPSLQKDTKTPDKAKCSYSRFKSSIVRRLSSKIPVASSPIATRWQQSDMRNLLPLEHSISDSLTFSSSSSAEAELLKTPENVTAIPATSKNPFGFCGGEFSKHVSRTRPTTSQIKHAQGQSHFKHQTMRKQVMNLAQNYPITKKACNENQTRLFIICKACFHDEVRGAHKAPLITGSTSIVRRPCGDQVSVTECKASHKPLPGRHGNLGDRPISPALGELRAEKLFSEVLPEDKISVTRLGAPCMEICEAGRCNYTGCQEKGARTTVQQNVLAGIPNDHSPFHRAMRLHIPGLRNDYYLNLMDWNSANLVALALDSSAHVWDAGSCEAIGRITLSSSSKYISSVSWINEGTCLAVGTSDGEVQLWDIETKKRLRNMLGHVSVVGALNWNQHILTSGSRLGFVHHHDVRIPEHCVGMFRHQQAICSLKWSPSGHLLASGSSDGILNIRPNDPGATQQCKPMKTLPHSTSVKAMNWCPWLSETLAVGGGMKDGLVRVWDICSGRVIHSAQTSSQICSLLWLPETKELVTGHGLPRHQIKVWDYPSLTQVTELYGHNGRVLHLALSPDQRKIFSAAADGIASVWEYRNKSTHAPTSHISYSVNMMSQR
ncbi:cell division cycle protein 20 homolog B [Ambystoma mexicanum]|uniref:cell division cycle protein 20 homolog B n=1 Tax=Ambystoma mexicanum TaxID=8296 RepID=UPI0037E8DB52